ncbi:putative amino acid/polyamine transporter I [Rosa chinensis]|uniref:Putative amino acid/polyamine transporter I n=1 Tax=Rosa chinensis TaxID=74649 RepID=A0A2P6QNH6_ROSCH|nr:probable polyamine transporter At3g13620 [Rosa chinensis]PRQ35713.1 putative amino acid/polyamine transporter I [Rosa chinensis]
MKTPQHSPSSEKLLEGEEKQCLKEPPTSTKITTKKLAFIPLLCLIYFQVSGGPYGTETMVGAGGTFYAILGIIFFPILWSVPEALITAELSTAFPGNGGFVIWTHQAFGPFWGFLIGFWKFLSAVINLSSYPIICLRYIDPDLPLFSSSTPHYLVISVSTLFLSVLNFTGLHIVGYASISLGILSYLPFLVITCFAIPQIDPSHWVLLGQKGKKKDWPLFFNTLFWNMNCWDNVSTLVAEGVTQPSKTLPKAFLSSGLITCFAHLVPLLASVGAMKIDLDDWVDGYYTIVAEKIVGKKFKRWVRIGAFLSGIGVFQSQLSSCSYQLLGMTELGLLPTFFSARSKQFNTPWVGILISTVISILISSMKFRHVTSLVNVFYSLGMMFEIAAFISLRMKFPHVDRPFKVPLTKLRSLIAMCFFPFGFLLYVVCVGQPIVFLVVALLTMLGILWYFCMRIFQAKMWVDFNHVMKKLADYENLGYYDQIVK